MQVIVTIHDCHPSAESRVVDEGLDTFNTKAALLHEVQRLSCVARNEAGDVIGGAIGRWWGRCSSRMRQRDVGWRA